MVFPIAGGNESKGYEISNSLRLNDDDSAYLSFDPSSSGTTGTWTASWWMKLGNFTNNYILSSGAVNQRGHIFISSSTLRCQPFNSTGASKGLTTDAVLRDPSAWYHCVIVANGVSTSNISSNLKIYINGVEQSTSGTGSGSPSGGDRINDAQAKRIGELAPDGGSHFDGYLSEFHFIDGTAKAQTDFGEFDDNGVWIPKEYDGTYGTNGWYLEFKQTGTSQNSSGIGADTSGQDNHWAVTNLAATDITEDTCTNNFATLNPLFRSNFDNDGVYSEGNCQINFTSANSDRGYGFGSFGVTSGKWYWEIKIPTSARAYVGIGDINRFAGFSGLYYSENPSYGFAVNYAGQIEENDTATNSYSASFSDNDILMWALDMDNHRAYFGINGTWTDSGDPTSGSTGTGDVTTEINDQSHLNTGEPMFPFVFDNSTSGGASFQMNFGNPVHSISSGNTDGKYGNFEYAPPSGYYALCTKRLAEFG